MANKLFYYDTPEEFEEDREKAKEILKAAGFNEEVLDEEMKYSERDFGDEFIFTLVRCNGKNILEDWKKTHDLGNKTVARDFVMRLTYDGD